VAEMISGAQSRMARALLKWSVNDLCQASGVSSMTVKRIEKGDGIPNAQIATVQAIRDAFVATGKVRFEGDSCVCVAGQDGD